MVVAEAMLPPGWPEPDVFPELESLLMQIGFAGAVIIVVVVVAVDGVGVVVVVGTIVVGAGWRDAVNSNI